MRIMLYGRLADLIDPRIELDAAQGCTVGELRRRLAARHPAAGDALDRSRACVGSALVADDHCVAPGDEVEFLPPVSGG